MAEKKWVVCKADEPSVAALRAGGYTRVLSVLLANRGRKTAEEAAAFLSAPRDGFHDPLCMKGMDAAVLRIRAAIRNHEKITVYGDYDVDGVCATALLLSALKRAGADADFYIPERESEGYGLNEPAVRSIAGRGTTLIVTVDTGVSAIREAAVARELGTDLIITDHHEPRSDLPEAYAVVNPKQPGCPYPFRGLSGVGVAFKLACALESAKTQRELFARYGDLVCLGTVADVVPLTDENRGIVQYGLGLMEKRRNAGLAALCDVSGVSGKKLTATLLAFTLAPRINAAGRMGSPKTALELLLCEDKAQAAALAQTLERYNRERQETEKGILEEITGILNNDPSILSRPVIVVSGKNWHNGVVGIAASRMVEQYGKPCVLVSFDGGEGRASCRSVAGFDIFRALSACSGLLEKYGGHTMAAGFTVRRERYEEFLGAFFSYADSLDFTPEPELRLECELLPDEITLRTADAVARLEPFGCGNPAPLFLLAGALVTSAVPLSGGKHCKLGLMLGGRRFSALLFNVSRFPFVPRPDDAVDLAVSLEANLYNGSRSLGVYIRDIRPTRLYSEQAELYSDFLHSAHPGLKAGRAEFSGEYYPVREDFAAVYRYFLTVKNESIRLEEAFRAISGKVKSMSFFKLLLITDIFEETGLIATVRRADLIRINVIENRRVDLNSSSLLKKLKLENQHG